MSMELTDLPRASHLPTGALDQALAQRLRQGGEGGEYSVSEGMLATFQVWCAASSPHYLPGRKVVAAST
jgi:hypothetical protein